MSIFYLNKNNLNNDLELIEFWDYFKIKEASVKINLPQLNYDNLVNFLTYIIFNLTGWHEMVGSIVEYLVNPSFLAAKLVSGHDVADVETFYLSLSLIGATGKQMPKLINDWSHIHNYLQKDKTKYNKVKKVLNNFINELTDLSDKIDKLNSSREIAFNSFNPKYLECSVSL